MLSLVRPRYFVPIHGEYRQLSQHARIARRVMSGQGRGVEVLLAGDGDLIRFNAEGAKVDGKAPAGRVLIDTTRTGEVGDEVLRDRRNVAAEGIVVAVLAINQQTGALVGDPEIIPRGFVMDPAEADPLLREAALVLRETVAGTSIEERTDQGLMTEKVRIELRRFFKKRSGRRPLVLPVLMEI